MTTRRGEQLKSLNWEAALNEQKLVDLGWCPVAIIDAATCTTWRQMAQKVNQLGYGERVTDDWCNIPLVVKNQNVLTVDTTFLNKIESIKRRLQFLLNVKETTLKKVNLLAYYQS